MKNNEKNALILAIVNSGYDDMVMAAAESAGAMGGTLLDARGIGHEDVEKFLRISIQPEKTIVAILCGREEKSAIMQAINQSAGVRTEARGILLSLPVDNVMGIGGLE